MLCDNMGPFIRQNKKYTCIGKKVRFVRARFIAHTLHSNTTSSFLAKREKIDIVSPVVGKSPFMKCSFSSNFTYKRFRFAHTMFI